jgi:hypothetical protein
MTEVRTSYAADGYVTSFRVEDAFGDETRDEIASGLPVTFRYFLEVRRRGWFRTPIAEHEVAVTVELDTLTRQYHLTRYLDGQVTASLATDKPDEMQRWMSAVADLRLGPLPEARRAAGPLFLRVKCRLGAGFVGIFFPRYIETEWEWVPLPPPRAEEDRR